MRSASSRCWFSMVRCTCCSFSRCIHTHTHTRIHTHARTRTRTHTHTHAHAHAHTQGKAYIARPREAACWLAKPSRMASRRAAPEAVLVSKFCHITYTRAIRIRISACEYTIYTNTYLLIFPAQAASWWWGFGPVYTLWFVVYHQLGVNLLFRRVPLMSELSLTSASGCQAYE